MRGIQCDSHTSSLWLRRRHLPCSGMDCGILFSTYDLLISSKSLGKEAKARLKAAQLMEKAKLQQGKDDGDADKIQFGAHDQLGPEQLRTRQCALQSASWVDSGQYLCRSVAERCSAVCEH